MSHGVLARPAFPASRTSSQPSSPPSRAVWWELRGSALESLSLGMSQGKIQIQTHMPSSQTHLTLPQVIVTSEKHVQVKSPGNSEKTKIYIYTSVCISYCIISTWSSFALPVTLFLQDEDCFDGLQLTGGGAQSHQRPTLWGWIQEDWWCPPVSGWPCVQPCHQSRPCPKGTMLQPGRCENPFRVAASGTHTDLEESHWNSPTN